MKTTVISLPALIRITAVVSFIMAGMLTNWTIHLYDEDASRETSHAVSWK